MKIVTGTSKHSSLPRQVAAGVVLAAALAAMGCGNNYRPVVSSINPVGPAVQPTKYAVAVSSPSATAPGLITFVDVFGDSVLVNANVGANPTFLQLDPSGSTGYTLNGDGTVNSFAITSTLMTNAVLSTTLLNGAGATSITSQGTNVYIAQGGRKSIAQLTGTPPALQQEIPTTNAPAYTVAVNGAPRVYALTPASSPTTTAGTAVPIETAANTPDAPITVGINPTYGVMTADERRVFVMNRGSNTVSVINAQTNALDTFSGAVTTGTIAVGIAPVWADLAPTLNELVVANSGNGTTASTVSIISIPLCSATAVSNANCDPNNPIDAAGFGTVVASVKVGVNPVMVTVLSDGSKAYVANAGNAAAGIAGSVSVINLTTNTVIATLPAISTNTTLLDASVHGHPNWIVGTTGTPTGKVYVTAADATDLTVIRTDTDVVTTHIALQGSGISVRVTAQ